MKKKNVACDILAPSAVAFMQHFPFARVRFLSGAIFYIIGSNSYDIKNKTQSSDWVLFFPFIIFKTPLAPQSPDQ